MMATIKTESIEPDRERLGGGVVVSLNVRTSKGQFTFAFTIEDQGDMWANEQEGRRELRIFLQEALQVLGDS
jgi:hypothetical protein